MNKKIDETHEYEAVAKKQKFIDEVNEIIYLHPVFRRECSKCFTKVQVSLTHYLLELPYGIRESQFKFYIKKGRTKIILWASRLSVVSRKQQFNPAGTKLPSSVIEAEDGYY